MKSIATFKSYDRIIPAQWEMAKPGTTQRAPHRYKVQLLEDEF